MNVERIGSTDLTVCARKSTGGIWKSERGTVEGGEER